MGFLSDPFKGLGDLQRLGMKRARLESRGGCFFLHTKKNDGYPKNGTGKNISLIEVGGI